MFRDFALVRSCTTGTQQGFMKKSNSLNTSAKSNGNTHGDASKCPIHTFPKVKHDTKTCRVFLKKSVQECKSLIQHNQAFYGCFKNFLEMRARKISNAALVEAVTASYLAFSYKKLVTHNKTENRPRRQKLNTVEPNSNSQ